MLGMPEADKDLIRDWSGAIVKMIDPVISEEEVAAALDADEKMGAHLAKVIDWKADNRGDDLLTLLLEAEDDGDTMTRRELRDQVSLLFIAGHETTVNLIGTGIRELLRHPDQFELVRAHGMPATGIDELLRWVSPVQITRRVATADIEFRGKRIPKGALILVSLASSNRDPRFLGSDCRYSRPCPRQRRATRVLRLRHPLLLGSLAGKTRSRGRNREFRKAVRSGRHRG